MGLAMEQPNSSFTQGWMRGNHSLDVCPRMGRTVRILFGPGLLSKPSPSANLAGI